MTKRYIFEDSRSRDLLHQVEVVAGKDIAVLISGPTGSGKEVIARLLHQKSPRSHGPFVAVNCGAISPNLIESELFGCVRGAFTGAVERKGYLDHANGGTLFLDEIGDLPHEQQVKLLRVLDGQPYFPVGSTRERVCDIRFIGATNRDLVGMCRDGRFRDDLYGRIRQIELRVPPLNERPGDVSALARHFAARHRTGDREFADTVVAAVERLSTLPGAWPRGIRELEAFVIRAECFEVMTTEDAVAEEWRGCEGEPRGFVIKPQPGRDDRDRLTGLIMDRLRTSRGRRRHLASRSTAMLLADRLLSGAPLTYETLQEILDCDRRTMFSNLSLLIECGLLFDDGGHISLEWPPVTVRLFCRQNEDWLPVAPGAIPLARHGDRIRIEVCSQLAVELRVFGVTHRRGGSEPRRLLIKRHHITARQAYPVEFELDEQPGFEQIFIHLSWPASRGLRPVEPDIDSPFTPTTHILQRERSQLVEQMGPGWVEEYLLHHL